MNAHTNQNLRRNARAREAILMVERGVRRYQVCQYCLYLQQNGSTRFLVGCLVSPREPNGKCVECTYKKCDCVDGAGPPMGPAAPVVPAPVAPVAPVNPVAPVPIAPVPQQQPTIFFPPTFTPPMVYPTYLIYAPSGTLQPNAALHPPIVYVPQVPGTQAPAQAHVPLQSLPATITPPQSLNAQPVVAPPTLPRPVHNEPPMIPLAPTPSTYPRNLSIWSGMIISPCIFIPLVGRQ